MKKEKKKKKKKKKLRTREVILREAEQEPQWFTWGDDDEPTWVFDWTKVSRCHMQGCVEWWKPKSRVDVMKNSGITHQNKKINKMICKMMSANTGIEMSQGDERVIALMAVPQECVGGIWNRKPWLKLIQWWMTHWGYFLVLWPMCQKYVNTKWDWEAHFYFKIDVIKLLESFSRHDAID